MGEADYYGVLGLEKDATPDQVKQAYRRLAFQCHPDRNLGNPDSTEKMKQVNEAYATLCDPAKRREYDFLRERYGDLASDRFRQAHSGEDMFQGTDIEQVLQEFARAFGFRSPEAIFRDFYGGAHSYEFRGPGTYGRVFIFGGQPRSQRLDSSMPAVSVPPLPGFLGKLIRFVFKRITGLEFPEKGKDMETVLTLRSDLAAAGGEVKYRHRANGVRKALVVKVPPGIKTGQGIRLKGMGGTGRGGAEPGDLYLRVKVVKPWWRRLFKRTRE